MAAFAFCENHSTSSALNVVDMENQASLAYVTLDGSF